MTAQVGTVGGGVHVKGLVRCESHVGAGHRVSPDILLVLCQLVAPGFPPESATTVHQGLGSVSGAHTHPSPAGHWFCSPVSSHCVDLSPFLLPSMCSVCLSLSLRGFSRPLSLPAATHIFPGPHLFPALNPPRLPVSLGVRCRFPDAAPASAPATRSLAVCDLGLLSGSRPAPAAAGTWHTRYPSSVNSPDLVKACFFGVFSGKPH